ncbi:hypothetical protein Hamer_G020911 [Homarus americanus]|uniref:Uncharacterized protein n=1 Tax=Homarus americanus TaxID=6706 RepID=A0A8J5NCJ5_HOMAM|nr:hypothetical protein Hamer_G020911 [Homarus americanus]
MACASASSVWCYRALQREAQAKIKQVEPNSVTLLVKETASVPCQRLLGGCEHLPPHLSSPSSNRDSELLQTGVDTLTQTDTCSFNYLLIRHLQPPGDLQ